MESKKYKNLSIGALIINLFPFVTFIDILLKLNLLQYVQSLWAITNLISVIISFILSVICVKNKDSRSIVNIFALIISSIWGLMILGIVELALIETFA